MIRGPAGRCGFKASDARCPDLIGGEGRREQGGGIAKPGWVPRLPLSNSH